LLIIDILGTYYRKIKSCRETAAFLEEVNLILIEKI